MSFPYRDLETVFLDVGNTLVSIDFSWVAAELAARRVPCDEEQLRRAEAAARPSVSEELSSGHGTESESSFRIYLGSILRRLPATAGWPGAEIERLSGELDPVLRVPGHADRLWNHVLPGVRQSLAELHRAGLRLVVVSNADGSVERSLAALGLRPLLDLVCDSHVVGHEKPDPRIFRHALELAGADPARTVHVGDLYHFDVLGARRAGIHPVLLDPFGDWDGVDCVRHRDLAELAEQILLHR